MKKTRNVSRLILIVAYLSVIVSLNAATYYVRTYGSTVWGNITGSPTIVTLTSGNVIASFADLGGGTGADTYYFAPGTYNINFALAITTGQVYGGFSGNETSTADLSSRVTSDQDANGIVEPWEFSNVVTFTTSVSNGNYGAANGTGTANRLLTVTGTGGEVNGITLFDYFYNASGSAHGVIVLGEVNITPTDGLNSSKAGKLTQCIVRQIKNFITTSTAASGIVMLTNASSLVDRCLIEDCRIPNGSGTIYLNKYGGTVSNSVIRNNYVKTNGGGVWLGGSPATTVDAVVSNCAVYNNSSATNGGAIRGDANSTAGSKGIQVVNCTVVNNTSGTSVSTTASSIELINSGLVANTISVSDYSAEIRPHSATNYIVSTVYGDKGGTITIYPGTDNYSGIADLTFTSLYFKRATTFQGAVGNSTTEVAAYTLAKKNEIKAANYQIINSASIAYTTPNAALPATFPNLGGVSSTANIDITASVPATDINGETRNAIGAYNYKAGGFTVTVNPATADGTATGGGVFSAGETVSVSATATATGKRFANWTIDGVVVSTNKSYSFSATEEMTVVANFADVQTTYYVRPTGSSAWGNIGASADQIITTTDAANNFNLAYKADNTADGTATYYMAAGDYTLYLGGTSLNAGKIYGGFSGSESSIDLNARATSDLDENGLIEAWEMTNATVLQGREGLKYAQSGSGSTGERLISLTNSAEVNGVTLTEYNYGTYTGAIAVGTAAGNPANDDDGKQGFLKRSIVRKIKSAIGVVALYNSRSVVDQCLIEDCLGTTSYGAVYFNRYGGTLSNSVIRNNKATTEGGAVYAGNAVTGTDLKAKVTNCLIYNNEATTKGGAISSKSFDAYKGGVEIVNSTIANNKTGSGAAAVELDGTGLIANSIVAGNTVADLYATSTTNYVNGVVYGTTGAGSAGLTETNTVSGKITTDMNFANPTLITGYLGIDVNDDYNGMRAAKFYINNTASTAVSTTSLATVPAYYSTITTYSTVPETDITGFQRTGNYTLGAYQATLNVPSGTLQTINQDANLAAVTVAPGGKLTLSSGKSLTTATFYLESDDSNESGTFVDANTTNGLTVTGTTTVEQYLAAGRNWFISIPVQSVLSGIVKNKANSKFWSYNEANEGTVLWPEITATDIELTRGLGYVAKLNTADVITYNGTLNSGSFSTPSLSRSGVVSAGFHVVGNPYPSYLNWNAVTKNNVDNTIWYRTKVGNNPYKFYTYLQGDVFGKEDGIAVPGGLVTNLIPPMQGFWVRVSAGQTSGSLDFSNAMRAHKEDDKPDNKLKAPAQNSSVNQLLRLQISNGSSDDETVVYFNPNVTNGLDSYDSPKMFNNIATQPEIYTKADNEKLVINGLAEINNGLELPLGFTTGTSGNFELKLSELRKIDSNIQVYLLDNTNKTETELTTQTPYLFTSDITSNNESRFSLLFRIQGGITENTNADKLNPQIYVNADKQITIITAENSNYSIYNVLGQKIDTGVMRSGNYTSTIQLKNGIYVVHVSDTINEVKSILLIK